MYKLFSEALHNTHQCTSSSASRYKIFTNEQALQRGVTQYSPMNKLFSEALHNTHQCISSSARRYTVLTNVKALQQGVKQNAPIYRPSQRGVTQYSPMYKLFSEALHNTYQCTSS
ncbi:hypothetical protein DPMN_136326 [Dreissena polymorpha]|uniref:Uncharacterized protein n=1 Tax=Dreissena polymorpha TaxID=45954 RepID=A0A9D4JGL5_DREPO|nr:hypothetical protein DPMN_136326 [Dreissena polymorpha]